MYNLNKIFFKKCSFTLLHFAMPFSFRENKNPILLMLEIILLQGTFMAKAYSGTKRRYILIKAYDLALKLTQIDIGTELETNHIKPWSNLFENCFVSHMI